MMGNFSNPLYLINGSSEQNTNAEIGDKGCYKSNRPKRHLQSIPQNTKEYAYFSAINPTFFKIYHIVGHKESLKKIEVK